jgi:hypothetical protein
MKDVLHYKPCLLTSLSSRKSWEIFAIPIEKIDFLIFAYTNFRGHLKKYIFLKLEPKISFGNATLKSYRKVNTHPKATINSSF